MYRENSLNTLACQKRDNTTMGHKMLLQTDMKVLKEYKKLLSGGKTKDTLVAYYIYFIAETEYKPVEQKHIVFISGGLKDRTMKATKVEHFDISELRKEANTRLLHATVAAKHPNTYFLFLIVTSPS